MPTFENRLAQATSPYLQQHKHNPVDWYQWEDEALQLARDQDKPILLSIGYSACHWCHVMAHESFEDEATAALMNEYFVNIKVDREERPDLDKIYQLAQQLLNRRSGGWPLTIFLMPEDHTPFFAGTYFPPVERYGMRSFKSILQAVHEAFQHRRTDIEQQNQSLREHLQQISRPQAHRAELTEEVFAAMTRQLLDEYDRKHGGFTPQPKFPHAYFSEFCLRQYQRFGAQQQELLDAGMCTLRKMAQGGLFDQIGGGFCRYSTDELWMIPHFEKMLYDNGQLMPVYVWANQLQPDADFKRAVSLTADWLIREMQSVEGGYFSAQDADSEGEEGRYYVWSPEEVAEVLSSEDYKIYSLAFGFDRSANFEGRWYPHRFNADAQLATNSGLSVSEIHQALERARQQLLEVRNRRVRPGTDDKVLTSWNALMIRGMLIAARALGRPRYADSAMSALEFIRRSMWQQGRLLASWKDGRANLNAYLDDYAYLLLAVLEALQTRWDGSLLRWCQALADSLIELFANEQGGGFYFTSHDHEQLIMRSQSFNDDAMPAGNAIAAQALYYLGFLSGETRYLD